MFKAANPYDEIVVKATDENLTSENWQLNLDVCDKVTSDGATGSRNCVAAILKRLVHRNANVQLYSLTLSDALSKNCGEIAHQELASRSFTQTLQRIITDRNTHDTVKKKSLGLIKEWNSEWGNDESLGLIRETMESLKKQGFSFTQGEQKEVPPTEPSSEQLRAEDEELRKVLELSLQDQGGRGGTGYSAGPPVAGSSSSSAAPAAAASSAPVANNGYTPSQPYSHQQADQSSRQTSGSSAYNPASAAGASSSSSSSAVAAPAATQSSSQPAASRVRALYDFTPTESGELAFRQGDIIRVLDSVYEHWWRGEINGEVGIFPVNFVEVLPDPTPADVQREAEMEAKIFAQANDIDRLLSKLRGLDPSRDNLAEDEELQELYQSSLSMRPKIVKLIDRYNLKVNELRSMNEKFVRARSTFDAMMEQSLAKYNSANAATSVSAAPQRADYAHATGAEYGYAPSMAGQPAYQQQQQQYHQHYNQQQPQQVPYQQTPQAGPGSEGQQQPSTAQQQQEYAQSWAAWYAQNGYQQPSPGQGPGQGQGQSHHLQHSTSADGSIPAPPPNVNDPAYSQWYYSNQQQQQQQNPPQHLAGSTGATATASAPSAPMTTNLAYNYGPSATAAAAPAPGGGSGDDSTSSAGPHDQDKRAMFERARAEAEAYHRAHQQQQQQQQHHMTNSNSQNELPLQ